MDVFVLRNRLITDYGDYIKSFINIADTRIAEYVGQEAHQLNLPDAAQHLLFAAERSRGAPLRSPTRAGARPCPYPNAPDG